MGFNLADIGLMGSGVNEVLDLDRVRRQAAEDRAALLEERKRKEEEAVAAQEEARRQRAYLEEARATMGQHLAGGALGIPAQAAVAGQVLDPRQQEGGDVPIAPQAAKPAQDNTLGMYESLQKVAAKHGRLDQFEAMKKRFDTAKEEGVVDFIRKARQGASEPDLMDAFNQTGKVKLAGLRKMNDDEYAGVTADGKPVRLNLTSMTESLLGPKDMLTHQDRSERTAATLESKRLTLEQQDRANAARAGEREANIALKAAQADAARARAGKDDRAPAGNGRTAGNWNQYDSQLRQLATVHLTSTDPDTGKPVLDRKNLVMLTSMAGTLARQDPNLSPAEALQAGLDKLDEIRNIQDASLSQAEEEAKGYSNQGDRAKYVKDRTAKLVKMRTTLATEKAGATAAPAAPAAAAAAKPPVSGAPAEPSSEEEFAALPSGARYVNPKDGKVYVKK